MPNHSAVLDRVFSALADPSRRAMVERLSRGPSSVSELAAPFEMSLPAVLQHLQVLQRSGLVLTQKAGRVRTCRIDPATLSAAEQWVHQQQQLWETGLDRLEIYLTAEAAGGADEPSTETQGE